MEGIFEFSKRLIFQGAVASLTLTFKEKEEQLNRRLVEKIRSPQTILVEGISISIPPYLLNFPRF